MTDTALDVNPVHTASECYGPGRNLTVDCPSGSKIRIRQISLGISKNHNCPNPATWNVPTHCCTPGCDDCYTEYDNSAVLRQQCEGNRRCNVITQWRRNAYGTVSKCASQLTNYMLIAYECTRKSLGIGRQPLESVDYTQNLVCHGITQTNASTITTQATKSINNKRPRVLQAKAGNVQSKGLIPYRSSKSNDTIVQTYKINKVRLSSTTNPSAVASSTTPQKTPTTIAATTVVPTTTSRLNSTTTIANITYNIELDNLGSIAKSEAILYGSTAGAAVFIVSIGILVAWLFCRRKFDHKQPLARKISAVSIPIYAYSDPHHPGEPAFYHDCMVGDKCHDMRMVQLACPAHHDYCIDGRPNEFYPCNGAPPAFYGGFYGTDKTRKPAHRHESFTSAGKVSHSNSVLSKKKTPSPARRMRSADSCDTESSVDAHIKPEFKHYVPLSEALDDDGKTSDYSAA